MWKGRAEETQDHLAITICIKANQGRSQAIRIVGGVSWWVMGANAQS